MCSEAGDFKSLKQKFDVLVKKDEDVNKGYNKIFHTCLTQIISDMKRSDATFGRLYREIFYGGSFYDNLAVGNMRHEFDLNVILHVRLSFEIAILYLDISIISFVFKVPEDGFDVVNTRNNNFMKFSTKNKNLLSDLNLISGNLNDDFEEIVENGIISPVKMKQMLKRAADKVVLSRSKYTVTLDNGVVVKVTRSDTVPYTLLLEPQSGEYRQTVEVDLLPALRDHSHMTSA